MQISKPGRTASDRKAKLQIRRALNAHAGQLAEKALAKALQGDGHALLACTQLLSIAATPPASK